MTGDNSIKRSAYRRLILLAGFLQAVLVVFGARAEPKAEALDHASPTLPSLRQQMDAKFAGLNAKLNEQSVRLAEAEVALIREQAIKDQAFDHLAYLSLSIFNSAPPQDYILEKTEVFLDGGSRPISKGGPKNGGLPRNNDQIYFAPVAPGCHELLVKATYTRRHNNFIKRLFNFDRVEKLERRQAFIAKDGYRVEIEIEGFEAQNTFVKLFRGPELRFNRSVRPNFLNGAPLVSLDQLMNQGQVRIDYLTDSPQNTRLLQKSLSIDGLPILTDQKHNDPEGNVLFEAPLTQGRHTLSVTLLFGEKPRVGGGPQINFKLSFERIFYVMSGQTSVVNLVGIPQDGFRGTPEQSRFARAQSKILSEEHADFFPTKSCKEVSLARAGGE